MTRDKQNTKKHRSQTCARGAVKTERNRYDHYKLKIPMKLTNIAFIVFATVLFISCNKTQQPKTDIEMKDLMIRISEIEIDSNYLEEYKCILIEEAKTSVRVEPGVISIYPMFKKDNPTQVRILEIYANRKAYKSHLETTHFLKYKSTTLKMVKSLQLLDMESIAPEMMPEMFCKLKIR